MKTRVVIPLLVLTGLLLAGPGAICRGQTLNVPPRPANAPTGSQFGNMIQEMSQTSRENWVLYEVTQGNLPSWMRTLVPITLSQTISGTHHTLTYYVLPDYLSIGSDTDYFQEPMSPILAQRIANLLNCTLPTRLMVNQIWTNSAVKMTANEFSPGTYDISSPSVFVLENTANMTERYTTTNSHPLGTLVSGDKKDIVESTLIYTNLASGVPNPVVIYGWIQPDGAYIQELFNGHAETYMDYSHGTRLVQMAVTLDGVSNNVTNILNDPVLNPLLSDEGVIAKPYYTIDSLQSPYIIVQPVSQNIKLGGTATLSVAAEGYAPMSYVWKNDGAPVSGATSSTLAITNAQAANAGTYAVVVSNSFGVATNNLPAILRVTTNAFPLLFSDTLGTDTSANWNFFFGSAGSPDYTTNWAFDYGAIPYNWNGSTYLIPPAPSTTDGSTRGLKLTVNDSNGVICGVNIYPKGRSFSNNFALKFDMWLNYPGGSGGSGATGTTEFAICGINHLGTEPDWDATNALSTDGLWFAVDGEGGSSQDYRAFLGNPAGNQTAMTQAAAGLVAVYHTNSPFPTFFPENRFESAGTPGKTWVGGEIDQSNGVVTWKMDGNIIAQRSNTSAYTNGDIMLGYMDIFPSVASPLADAFILFDNVRVEDWTSAPLTPPAFTLSPANPTVLSGTNVTLSANTTGGSTPFTYQWSFNGTNIPAATASSYLLIAAQPSNSGSYSVVASNVAGSVIRNTTLTVNVRPFSFNAATLLAGGHVQLSFNGALGTQYILQTSSNLLQWIPLTNLTDNANPVTFTDTNAAPGKKFYRLVTSP